MSQRVSNITSCVTSVINQMSEYGISTKHYPRIENMAVSIYSDKFRGFHMPSIEVSKFPVTLATRIWSYPPDYIRYTKIFYQKHGMAIEILGLNEDLNISGTGADCNTPPPLTSGQGYWMAEGRYGWGGQYNQPLYGVGGGTAENYYRPDSANQCIRFYENLTVGNAYIEYLSSGKNVGAQTLVPQAYRGAYEAAIVVRICQMMPKVARMAGAQIYDDFKRQAGALLWDANILEKGLTEQELRDVVYRASGFTIR